MRLGEATTTGDDLLDSLLNLHPTNPAGPKDEKEEGGNKLVLKRPRLEQEGEAAVLKL
jgi:hypothetical protein